MTLLPLDPSLTRDLANTRQLGRRNQSLILMLIVSLLMLGGLGGRLAYLQLVEGARNRQLAENNRIRLVPKPPERGKILDRKGRILAGSRLSHSVYVWPPAQKDPKWHDTEQQLAEILKIPAAEIQKRLKQADKSSPYLVRVARGISPQQVTNLEEAGESLVGVEVDAETAREYRYGDLAAHVLGYTGELNDEEYEQRREHGYRLGDVIGKMGVEASYEATLRGEWGGQQVEVDGAGNVLRILGEKPTRAGRDITLTLDLDLQRAATEILGSTRGSIIVMDPNNGGILAMVSQPAFDPNIFSKRVSESTWQRLQEGNALLNRALQHYPPASTFKIVTTAAAIESGHYTGNEILPTYPSLTVGGVTFGEWNHAGFGPLGFTGAMAHSSDTFFYQVALKMKGEPLIDWSKRFGFGQKTGIDLPDEDYEGLVPDPAWKLKHENIEWSIGDAINMSIGQGYLLGSPLQVGVMFSVAANGGYRVKPHLLKDNEESKNWRDSLNMSPKTITILQKGLREVNTYGTGSGALGGSAIAISGKSGTAEDFGKGSHTWFGAYAPADKPEIVVVAMGEYSGGGGGSLMGPKARQVIEAYFNLKQHGSTKPKLEVQPEGVAE
ncbi:MAG: penicillin-binding protein 2 [Synechococcales bacterium]|nr:penicillin-binding protein 2 [Synechococcales bacterium]